jgi:replicative superfamily II helicase
VALKGLFIGIDRYSSPDINWLSCARRDATALHALFTDTLGTGATLLVDEEANLATIQAQFEYLSTCDPDDIVVIGFSGHGSETHQLVTYDTIGADLANTSIPLDVLEQWFSCIPARRLIFFLDCCFSGGMGAKVFRVDSVPRDLRSVEARLDALSGEGRLILTASGPTEPAYENGRLGHGFLTYHLLEALQGAEEVVENNRIHIYRLLEYVTRRVIDAARQIGQPQHPTMRGSLNGELSWPIFKPGALYQANFPERSRPTVTSDIASLAPYGFPDQILAAWAGAIPGLNPLQIDAINEFGVLDGAHLVVSAPTSSGKTMVGELSALSNVLNRRRALFLLPLKALVADKQRQFERLYGEFGVRTIEATGETDNIAPLLRGQYDIALLTYEKFAAIVLTYPHVLNQVGTVVVDEAQMIADPSRGANLEFILTLVRMARLHGVEPQVIALSAVIGDTNGLERWLGARLLRRTERPVPLDEGLLLSDGCFRYLDAETGVEMKSAPKIQRLFSKGSSQDWVIPLVDKLVSEGKQVIVFRETKGEAKGCALYLAQSLRLPPAAEALAALPEGDPSQASRNLRQALQSGVAFHNADLDRDERRAIEEAFRAPNATLRVIAATTTLAMGVNTPASAVVVVGLEHPGPQPYTVAEYKNLVGRAGRLGFSERGTSYLLALDGRTEHHLWGHYVRGVPEDLQSRFLDANTDARTLIVRVLVAARRAAGEGVEAEEIIQFLESSFGAFQETQLTGQWRWSHNDLMLALKELVQHRLVEMHPNGRYDLTALGRLAGEGACEVGSIIRLVDCLGPLNPTDISDPTLITAVQTTVELDQVLFPINKKSTQKEPQTWYQELRLQAVPNHVLNYLRRGITEPSQDTLRAKKAVACLFYVSGKPMAGIEAALTQFGGASRDAAGPIRAVAARTCDVLPTAGRIAELLHPGIYLTERIGRLLVRLELGIPADAAEIGRYAGNRLSRGDYQRLVAASLFDASVISISDDATILACVENNQQKLTILRDAANELLVQEHQLITVTPLLEPYVA